MIEQPMNLRRIMGWMPVLLSFSLLLILPLGATAQEKPRNVKRVKRPEFKPKDWDGVYFQDLFREGLVGQRPAPLKPGQAVQSGPGMVAGGTDTTGDAGGFRWSKYVSATTLEDEVKALQQTLVTDITTPGKFKSDYAKVHQSFSMLSMLFAVIREYDQDVRWQEDAAAAQASFERAAANSRVGTVQAYESCKRRRDDLQEMVRGGNFAGEEKPPETLDWSLVVGHSPIMERLETSYDSLKTMTSSKGEFTQAIPEVLHESELVALMAQAVQREDMEYAAEETYCDYAGEMSQAAVAIGQACRDNDYDAVSLAVNKIGQACSNCHDEFR